MQFLTLGLLGRRIKAIPHMLRDRSVPKRKKAMIVFGIVYLFLPFHFIPPVVFTSRITDLILWVWLIWYLRDELDKYWIGEKPQDLSKHYKNKTIIDNVEYEIKKEEEH